jgi:hypothetical protein
MGERTKRGGGKKAVFGIVTQVKNGADHKHLVSPDALVSRDAAASSPRKDLHAVVDHAAWQNL